MILRFAKQTESTGFSQLKDVGLFLSQVRPDWLNVGPINGGLSTRSDEQNCGIPGRALQLQNVNKSEIETKGPKWARPLKAGLPSRSH